MTLLTCTECGTEQDVGIDVSTYSVTCEACRAEFRIPRQYRKNKKTVQEYTSRTNIRVGLRNHGDELAVGWTVQSAEKDNAYLEKQSVRVDISAHPEKLYWYVAIFKCLQNIGDYKEARIWVKDAQVLDHLSGDISVADDDVRTGMKQRIIEMASEKFYGCEFVETDTVGEDINRMTV